MDWGGSKSLEHSRRKSFITHCAAPGKNCSFGQLGISKTFSRNPREKRKKLAERAGNLLFIHKILQSRPPNKDRNERMLEQYQHIPDEEIKSLTLFVRRGKIWENATKKARGGSPIFHARPEDVDHGDMDAPGKTYFILAKRKKKDEKNIEKREVRPLSQKKVKRREGKKSEVSLISVGFGQKRLVEKSLNKKGLGGRAVERHHA